MKDVTKTIEAILGKLSIVFLSSVDKNGFPNTKAMLAPRIREGIQVFYFHTNTSSMRVGQYQNNSKACLYFCDQPFFKGIMFTGTVEVLEDDAHKELLWQEGDTLYYPGGVTDPDYCVLQFTATQGRFYSNFSCENFEIGSSL